MICADPLCTGVHDTSKPEEQLCPDALKRKRQRNRKWMADHYTSTAAGILAHVRGNATKRGNR